jgi:predicted Rossmann fold nucleotide-binding protein DprA/Smf involved in DNA uptake
MKIGIVGGRNFTDYQKLKKHLDSIKDQITEIISGGAKGADSLAERYAIENNIPLTKYLPEWNKFGKRAGIIRNEYIVKDSDQIIAVWDGVSKGTKNTIQTTAKHGKSIYVLNYGTKAANIQRKQKSINLGI